MLFQVANTNIIGTATGFFFEYSNDIYLITNRHVVEYSIKEDNPKLVFWVHTSESDLTQSKTIELSLKKRGDLTWYGYEETEIDIVAIPINKELINGAVIKSFFKKSTLSFYSSLLGYLSSVFKCFPATYKPCCSFSITCFFSIIILIAWNRHVGFHGSCMCI